MQLYQWTYFRWNCSNLVEVYLFGIACIFCSNGFVCLNSVNDTRYPISDGIAVSKFDQQYLKWVEMNRSHACVSKLFIAVSFPISGGITVMELSLKLRMTLCTIVCLFRKYVKLVRDPISVGIIEISFWAILIGNALTNISTFQNYWNMSVE